MMTLDKAQKSATLDRVFIRQISDTFKNYCYFLVAIFVKTGGDKTGLLIIFYFNIKDTLMKLFPTNP